MTASQESHLSGCISEIPAEWREGGGEKQVKLPIIPSNSVLCRLLAAVASKDEPEGPVTRIQRLPCSMDGTLAREERQHSLGSPRDAGAWGDKA